MQEGLAPSDRWAYWSPEKAEIHGWHDYAAVIGSDAGPL